MAESRKEIAAINRDWIFGRVRADEIEGIAVYNLLVGPHGRDPFVLFEGKETLGGEGLVLEHVLHDVECEV